MEQNLKNFILPDGFRGRSSFFVQLWWIVQAIFFACSPQFMYGWRRILLRIFGAKIGKNVLLRSSVKITYPWKLSIGDNSWIGDCVDLYTLDNIEIGSNVVVSQKSYLCTGFHNYKKSTFDIQTKKITIKDGVWIATDVFIAPGVLVGRNSIVGARSSVFSNIKPDSVYFGSPARYISKRLID